MTEHVKDLLARAAGLPAQLTPEWFAMREGRITASIVPAVLGDNRYQTPQSIYMKLIGRATKFQGNAATRYGSCMEALACRRYEEVTGETVHHFPFFLHPEHGEWLGGSPDGVTSSGGIIEIKCPMSREIQHACPLHYYGQLQTLMEIFDVEWCDFVQYRPADASGTREETLDILRVPRDREWWALKMPVLRGLWARAQAHLAARTERRARIREGARHVLVMHLFRARGRAVPSEVMDRVRSWRLDMRMDEYDSRIDTLAQRVKRELRPKRARAAAEVHPLSDPGFMEDERSEAKCPRSEFI